MGAPISHGFSMSRPARSAASRLASAYRSRDIVWQPFVALLPIGTVLFFFAPARFRRSTGRWCEDRFAMMPFRRRTTPAQRHDAAAPAPELTWRSDRTEGWPTVIVSGRVTVDSSPAWRAMLLELIAGAGSTLVVDLSGVSYLDTSGIATLFEILEAARARTVRLRIAGMRGQPRLLAEVTELEQIFAARGSEVELA